MNSGEQALAELTFRWAGSADAEALAALMAEGLQTYTAFASLRWQPSESQVGLLEEHLGNGTAWALIAQAGSRAVGQVTIAPVAVVSRIPSMTQGSPTCGSSSSRPPGEVLALRCGFTAMLPGDEAFKPCDSSLPLAKVEPGASMNEGAGN